MPKTFAAIVLVILNGWCMACVNQGAAAVNSTNPPAPGRLLLQQNWLLKSSVLVPEEGDKISHRDYIPDQWIPTTVPSTVLNALVKRGVYPDPRTGTNSFLIPDAADEFNQQHDLAKFSYLPDKRNPWRDPYWYRTGFSLPGFPAGQRIWLHFQSINYRAQVWLNGKLIADRDRMVGMFQRFVFDVTDQAVPGLNILAVKIYPVDHPGVPDTQLEVYGPDRGYFKEIMKDVTEVMTIGYDCMATVPDRNMGLCQDVSVTWSGPVVLRNPFVITDLPLPETNRATLTISAEVVNATSNAVKGILRGDIAGTRIRFEQPVELGPLETKVVTIDPKPVIPKPRLWWPVNYGEPYLYELNLQFLVDQSPVPTKKPASPPSTFTSIKEKVGKRLQSLTGSATRSTWLSSADKVAFGVRKITTEMHEKNGWHGRRILVNGQKIFCRGGYIQPELLLDWDARRMETEVRFYTQANLNLVYFEDIPNPPEAFLEACDRYGLMFGHCAYACMWLKPGTPYPADLPLLERCTMDLVKRYRNHPSLVLYMAMNEGDTRAEVYEMWRRHVLQLDGTRFLIPSAYFPDTRKDAPSWFKPDLPAGMTDVGASYGWQEPVTYFNWVRDKGNWMFMMESGSASLPPVSSLRRFIPNLEAQTNQGASYPLDATWAHHGANHYYKPYDQALRQWHGEPESVPDYCWKGHLVTADQHRALYEAVNHRLWDITSGFTEWKINACWPDVQWQIFDWYLKPMVSYYYIKKACEPLHIQLNLNDQMVSVINNRREPQRDLKIKARIFDFNQQNKWERSAKASVPANSYREIFSLSDLPDLAPLRFIKLELQDARGRPASENFYWLPSKSLKDLKALQQLPSVKLQSVCKTETRGADVVARVKITNPTDQLAFFIQLALTRGPGGQEVLPVFWEDNYFSLLARESKTVVAIVALQDLQGATPALEVGGWNIETDFECKALILPTGEVKAGEKTTLNAHIANTFIDGSRIVLNIDGQPMASKWVWAREGNILKTPFEFTLSQTGPHQIQVGSQTVTITAH